MASKSALGWAGHEGPKWSPNDSLPMMARFGSASKAATTSGISAVIDPYGVVHDATPTFATAVIDARIVTLRVATLYER